MSSLSPSLPLSLWLYLLLRLIYLCLPGVRKLLVEVNSLLWCPGSSLSLFNDSLNSFSATYLFLCQEHIRGLVVMLVYNNLTQASLWMRSPPRPRKLPFFLSFTVCVLPHSLSLPNTCSLFLEPSHPDEVPALIVNGASSLSGLLFVRFHFNFALTYRKPYLLNVRNLVNLERNVARDPSTTIFCHKPIRHLRQFPPALTDHSFYHLFCYGRFT